MVTAPVGARRSYFSVGASPGAIPELDGLRGIAILLVLLRHAARPVFEEEGGILQLGSWDLAVPLLNGWMGVDLFFVLSGFLITHHLLKHWPGRFQVGYFSRYWLKRVLRTFPAYYATLAVVAFGLLPFYRPVVEDTATQLWQHVLYLQDYFGSQWVPAFWSLGVEEKFYLLCPFVLLWLGRYPRARQLWILGALALLPGLLRAMTLVSQAGNATEYEYFFWAVRSPFHLALDGLWLGVICALIHRWRPPAVAENPEARRRLLLSAMALLAMLLLSVAWFDDRHFAASVGVLSLVSVAFAGIVLAVVLGPTFISAWLRARWLRFMAEVSYSVYLTHLIMVWPAMRAAESLWPGWGESSPILKFALFLVVFVAFSLVAGLILHFAVEKPFLILKNRVRMGAREKSMDRGLPLVARPVGGDS
jgi:peptidoglycan/LPS O-acetylase OafA/YrhL